MLIGTSTSYATPCTSSRICGGFFSTRCRRGGRSCAADYRGIRGMRSRASQVMRSRRTCAERRAAAQRCPIATRCSASGDVQVGHHDRRHAGGERRAHAGLGILEHEARCGASYRAGARPRQVDVGRGLAARDLVAADERREARQQRRRLELRVARARGGSTSRRPAGCCAARASRAARGARA